MKSLHRLKLTDSDLSTGQSHSAFEKLDPGLKMGMNFRG